MSETMKNVLEAAIMGLIGLGIFGVGLALVVLPIVFWGTIGVGVSICLSVSAMFALMFYSDLKRGRIHRFWVK